MDILKRIFAVLVILLTCASIHARELVVYSADPVVVVTSADWEATKDRPPSAVFPFETYRLTPPSDRNVMCLISILDNSNKPENATPEFLKKLLRDDSRPYVDSAAELPNIPIKELKIDGGLGYYANFIDPDLAGKPIKKGSYKTATPMILSLGTKYLIKFTVLCDDLKSDDYKEAMKLIESIKLRKKISDK
jgi:hypothetical protein